MIETSRSDVDLSRLVLVKSGGLVATDEPFEPYRLVDPNGQPVGAVAMFLKELQACGRSMSTQRSYGMALLRWFRFLWTVDVLWSEATRVVARDFCRWVQIGGKPVRPHWRTGAVPSAVAAVTTEHPPEPVRLAARKAKPGRIYAASTSAHSESVLRGFYDFHVEAGTGPVVNPFPLARDRRGERAWAHHNPAEPFPRQRVGRYRPRVVARGPRCIPDETFNELFAGLTSHRDRALVALWVSTGARASELLGATVGDVDAGQQLVTVIRKGTRAMQAVPASPDAFVWLRLYQVQMAGLVPAGLDDPLWWTLRPPRRPLAYHAAHRMFARVNARLGTSWTLHELRHTAAYRMARDPQMPLTDVQWVLGHARLSTTQLYVTPLAEDVIASVLAFHQRSAAVVSTPPAPALGYRTESLATLFGKDR